MRDRRLVLAFVGLILAGCSAIEAPYEGVTREPATADSAGPASPATVTGASWSRALTQVVWSNRDSHASVVFDGKIWVLGGWHTGSLADVWASGDGVSWREVTKAPWPARKAHAAVVFRDRMWILGGTHGVGQLSDVWASTDGDAWEQIITKAPWGQRNDHAAVVFDDRIFVLGGWQGGNRNDVWASSDGATWERVTAEAPWSARNNLAATVFGGRIWVSGGWGQDADGKEGNLDDVWSSADGIRWRQDAEHAPWRPRNNHTMAVYDGRLWVIGGWGEGNVEEGNLGDVWSTEDGEVWHPVTAQAPWLPRNAHTTVVYDDKLWVIGGWSHFIGGTSVNDLWYAGR